MANEIRLQRFLEHYPLDPWSTAAGQGWAREDTIRALGFEPELYTPFLASYAGTSHGNGIIKFLSDSSSPSIGSWNSDSGWAEAWPQWKGRLTAFAYDWLGDLFMFDRKRAKGQEYMVSILEPGTGQLLEMPHTFASFIDHATIKEADACLARSFYQRWLWSGGGVPREGECIGYKRPLFIGGSDTEDNLSVQRFEVYISLTGQIFSQTRNLPKGARLNGFSIK